MQEAPQTHGLLVKLALRKVSFPSPFVFPRKRSREPRSCPTILRTGDGLEGLSELPPEQAVVKLQRQNARLRKKAEAAMVLEQEIVNLKSQLQDMASQMVRFGTHPAIPAWHAL